MFTNAERDGDEHPRRRKRWAWLLAHVFARDLDHCPRCGGPMRWAEAATTPEAITRLLAAHGLGPDPPVHTAGVTPPLGQLCLPLG